VAGVELLLGPGTGRNGEVLELPGRTFLVGRTSKCPVRIRKRVVSRRHARLSFDGRAWVVEDLQSRNGTYLNGRRVSAAALRPRDTIRIGQANGPAIRVLSLDPSPPPRPDAKRRTPTPAAASPPIPTLAPLPRPPAAVAPPGALEAFRTIHVLVMIGMAFGLLTAWGSWGIEFPYSRAAAPVLWALEGVARGVPGLGPEAWSWLLRFLLALWFGMIGLALERPLRRLAALIVLGAIHVVAIAAFGW